MITYNSVVARIVLVDVDLDEVGPRVGPAVAAGLAAQTEGGWSVAVGKEDPGHVELRGRYHHGAEDDHCQEDALGQCHPPGHRDHHSLNSDSR